MSNFSIKHTSTLKGPSACLFYKELQHATIFHYHLLAFADLRLIYTTGHYYKQTAGKPWIWVTCAKDCIIIWDVFQDLIAMSVQATLRWTNTIYNGISQREKWHSMECRLTKTFLLNKYWPWARFICSFFPLVCYSCRKASLI